MKSNYEKALEIRAELSKLDEEIFEMQIKDTELADMYEEEWRLNRSIRELRQWISKLTMLQSSREEISQIGLKYRKRAVDFFQSTLTERRREWYENYHQYYWYWYKANIISESTYTDLDYTIKKKSQSIIDTDNIPCIHMVLRFDKTCNDHTKFEYDDPLYNVILSHMSIPEADVVLEHSKRILRTAMLKYNAVHPDSFANLHPICHFWVNIGCMKLLPMITTLRNKVPDIIKLVELLKDEDNEIAFSMDIHSSFF